MGTAPTQSQAAETVLVSEKGAAGTQASARTESTPQPVQHLNAGQMAAGEQHSLAQAEVQPAWRQGSSAQTPGQSRQTQAPPTKRAGRPVWREGADSPPEPAVESAPRGGAAASGQQVRLFQSAAFRGNFNALPKWKRVLSKVKGQVQDLNSCTSAKTCPPGATSWQRIMQQARGKQGLEQLKMVNSFFNKWPYRLDQDAYGRSDWWATPQEFLKISGDCEDYAIIKYFALRELGFSQSDLRIVVVKDRIRGIAHAVLAVFMQGEAYILNNISDAIFTHGKYRHYIPQYSLNEEYRWSHIPVAD